MLLWMLRTTLTLFSILANMIPISHQVKYTPLAEERKIRNKEMEKITTLMYFRNSIAFITRNELKFQAVFSQREERSWFTLNFMQLFLKSHELTQ